METCTFRVCAVLSVPLILGCDVVDSQAHAILPSDQMVRWNDGTATAILRGPHGKADRTLGVSCVLRNTHDVVVGPREAKVVWARTQWRGLGQVFGNSRLLTTHRATVANGVHDILAGVSFPVVVSNFGAGPFQLRAKANLGYIEPLSTGVIALPKRGTVRGLGSPGARTPDFGACPSPRPAVVPAGLPPEAEVVAVVDTGEGNGLDPGAAPSGGGGLEVGGRAGRTATDPPDPNPGDPAPTAAAAPPSVDDVELPDADPARWCPPPVRGCPPSRTVGRGRGVFARAA